MSTPTQSPGSVDAGWPITAVPQRWVEALFATMSATYGARFADLWRGSDFVEVKRLWGVELAKLSSQQMKAGRENLMQLVKAPTCPEFIAHCKQARRETVASEAFQLEHSPATSREDAAKNLGVVRQAMTKIAQAEPTAEWAFKILLRGNCASGNTLTYEATRCASDAVTSGAGRKVVEDCANPELREQYRALRQQIVDDYRMRGKRLWSVA